MHQSKVSTRLFLLFVLMLLPSCGCQDDTIERPPQLVPAETLAHLIPAQVGRWTVVDESATSMANGTGGTLTRVAGFLKLEERPPATFEIIDCLESPKYLAAIRLTLAGAHEFYRKFSAQGHPAVEIRNTFPISTNLEILVAERFWLKLGGEGQDVDTMAEILAGFDLAQLAQLAE